MKVEKQKKSTKQLYTLYGDENLDDFLTKIKYQTEHLKEWVTKKKKFLSECRLISYGKISVNGKKETYGATLIISKDNEDTFLKTYYYNKGVKK